MNQRPAPLRFFVRLLAVCAAVCVGLVSAGCAKPVVAAAPEPPPLTVPAVPPRLVGPVVVEEVPPPTVAQAPEEVAERPAPRSRPRPPVTDGTVARGESPASDNGRSEPVEPAASASEPAPLLRTPDTANAVEAVRRIRETMRRAQETLAKVNPKSLSRGARTNYESATRFIDQAEEALKSGRLDYAKFVAEKADTLSTGLLKR